MPHLRLAPPVPTRPGVLLPRRDLALGWTFLTAIAALAWLLTVARSHDIQSHDMGMEPATMSLALPLFLLLWVVMTAAMMLPSLAPVALTWVQAIRRNATGRARSLRVAEFVGGYLLAWAGFGLLALRGAGRDRTSGRQPPRRGPLDRRDRVPARGTAAARAAETGLPAGWIPRTVS
ncbi:DUF2182 domain-containing protein [Streptomyces sp. NPDC002888]|uniref:copper chaperone n=1 Tax=Streptomyces sp. NPDC002888 TaxID=3364668 RepID=UPI0036A754F3